MTKIYHRSYHDRRIEYDKIRDVIEGEDRLKKQGEIYLPRPEGMTQSQFTRYLTGGSFYAVAERTLRGLVGAATRNAPVIELPTRLEPMRDTATFEGNSITTLIDDTLHEVMSIGRRALVLDYPQEGAAPASAPLISTFDAESILDWRNELVEGRQKLTYLRLHEDDAELEDSGVEQHLVLTLDPVYTVRRYHVTRSKTDGSSQEVEIHEPITPVVNGKHLDHIPAVVISPYNLKVDVEKPPFLDLVNVNLAHWRVSADYYWSLFLTSQPTPWIAGSISEDNKPTQIGSGAFWVLPQGATAGMLEFTGAGIAAQKTALDDLTAQMATLGARMVYDGKGRNETTDTAKLRHRSELSLLHSSVVMVEEGIRKLLKLAAEWTQPGTSDQVKVFLHRDFVTAQMDPAVLTALLKSWQAGAISHDTFLMNVKKGELMDVNRTLDDEKDMIDEDETILPGVT
ncbi:DUF4055 domain-containing protein [Sulfitobacter sp. EE-36]|uniref:DUF4055 domain-containing protein n=1 Tax=Sulfitobacter TaxID=60136 RepID=UPI000066AFE4|nr:DUF4055 domain-containing protein [Sulfitobacter sp. EE-36]EAP83962.1 hypothetical protein EE36_12888 [Sulfitobacter sp. EE-36]